MGTRSLPTSWTPPPPTDEELGIPTRAAPQQTMVLCGEIEPGWVYIYADNPPADPARLPFSVLWLFHVA